MKKFIFFEIIKALQKSPKSMRKLKIFFVAGSVCIVIFFSLVTWTGYWVFNSIAATVKQLAWSQTSKTEIHQIKTELERMKFQPVQCWETSQKLLAINPWLETSVGTQLNNLKNACFQLPTVCTGDECTQIDYFKNKFEGRII